MISKTTFFAIVVFGLYYGFMALILAISQYGSIAGAFCFAYITALVAGFFLCYHLYARFSYGRKRL